MALAVTVDVYQKNGTTLIATVPRRKGVRWQDELNAFGVGQFSIHADDALLTSSPTLLDHGNIVKFTYAGAARFAFRIEQRTSKIIDGDERAGRWRTVSGRGVTSLLGDAVAYPEYGLTTTSTDERQFTFASKQGGWYTAGEWTTPGAVLPAADTTARGTKPPVGFPDPLAAWIGKVSPNLTTPAAGEVNWFRASFTLATAVTVKFYVTGDNYFTLYLNGDPVLTTEDQLGDHFLWRKVSTVSVPLAAGTHLVAARLVNGGTAPNSMALLLAGIRQTSAGKDGTVAIRSGTGAFLTYTGTGTPGWRASDVLLGLLAEAQARVVQACTYLTTDFTSGTDSAAVAFTDRQDLSVRVGVESVLDVTAKLAEAVIDVAVSPAMVLQVWKSRGIDRTATVTLAAGVSLVDHEAKSIAATATRLLVRGADSRWQEVISAAGETAAGRKEAGLTLGSSQSPATALAVATATLGETALERQTIESGRAPERATVKPYVHFGIGDTVLAPGEGGTNVTVRVAALTVEENDDGVLFYTPELYA